MKVLVYIGNSKWTNANRNHAIHIANETTRKPLCGKEYKNGALDVFETDIKEVTCKKCLNLLSRQNTKII